MVLGAFLGYAWILHMRCQMRLLLHWGGTKFFLLQVRLDQNDLIICFSSNFFTNPTRASENKTKMQEKNELILITIIYIRVWSIIWIVAVHKYPRSGSCDSRAAVGSIPPWKWMQMALQNHWWKTGTSRSELCEEYEQSTCIFQQLQNG